MEWRPVSFNIGTSKGKSVDIAQKIIEEDFSVTNMRDNNKPGEVAFMPEQPTKSETEAMSMVRDEIKAQMSQIETTNPQVQANIKSFFGGGPSNIMQGLDINACVAGAKAGPGGITPTNNPMTMLHQAGKKGLLPNNMRIVARG